MCKGLQNVEEYVHCLIDNGSVMQMTKQHKRHEIENKRVSEGKKLPLKFFYNEGVN